MAETGLFLSELGQRLILVVSPSEGSFRIIERNLARLPDCELSWHSDTIEALADIFMSRPALVVVFGDSNAQTLEFVQLVRNNRQFRELPIFAVLPEPGRMLGKLSKRLHFERFGTPVDAAELQSKAMAVIKPAGQARPI